MTTANDTLSPAQKARSLLKTLQENFAVFRDYAPLAIGIDKQIIARLPEVERKTLRLALGMHTHSLRYLKTMEKATHRLDIEGSSVEEVAEAHRTHATEVLRERFKKEAERRKAERQAEVLAQQQAKAERERSAKLNQLMEKFGKGR